MRGVGQDSSSPHYLIRHRILTGIRFVAMHRPRPASLVKSLGKPTGEVPVAPGAPEAFGIPVQRRGAGFARRRCSPVASSRKYRPPPGLAVPHTLPILISATKSLRTTPSPRTNPKASHERRHLGEAARRTRTNLLSKLPLLAADPEFEKGVPARKRKQKGCFCSRIWAGRNYIDEHGELGNRHALVPRPAHTPIL